MKVFKLVEVSSVRHPRFCPIEECGHVYCIVDGNLGDDLQVMVSKDPNAQATKG